MTRVVLIGCGKMGGAMLRGWISSGIKPQDISVLEPQGIAQEFLSAGVHVFTPNTPPPDVAVLAVKPQVMNDVCASIKSTIAPQTLILSIAAGKSIATFENLFGAAQPIIRAMPNTPAAIGKGITVAVTNKNVTTAQKETAHKLLCTTGRVEWVEDESLMDAVTALSGSGPAYVFLLIETLAKAGERTGLPADLAMSLARQTVIGSAALAETDATTSTTILRQNVTSPNGTTEAALKVLMDETGIQPLFDRALAAATDRSRELSK